MPRVKPSPLESLLSSPRVREAARALVEAVAAEAGERSLTHRQFEGALKEIERKRGRPLLFPTLLSGGGEGARRRPRGRFSLEFPPDSVARARRCL